MDKFKLVAEIPSFATATGALDIVAIKGGVERAIRLGFDIAIMAFAGEYNNLTLDDQSALLSACDVAASGRATIYAGTFEPSTERCIDRINDRAAIADCTHLVLPSFYFGLSNPEELSRHYALIQQKTGALILGVNSPAHTGFSVPEATAAQLYAASSITGFLDANADISVLVGHTVRAGVPFYVTDDVLIVGGAIRATGMVSRLALLFPKAVRALATGCYVAPSAVRAALFSLVSSSAHLAAPIKYAAHALGLCGHGDPLPPTLPLDAAQRNTADAAISALAAWEARYEST